MMARDHASPSSILYRLFSILIFSPLCVCLCALRVSAVRLPVQSAPRHSGIRRFAEVEDAHKAVVAAEVDGAGPAGAVAGGVGVLDEVEAEHLRDAAVLVGDG